MTALDAIIEKPGLLPKARWGLVTNEAARTAGGRPSRLALLETGLQIQRLFSPEHGLQATGEDGAPQPDGVDKLTGLPITSLYGEHLAPLARHLEGLDAILFDIPDIGCRFYTYLWTLTHVMEACAQTGKPLFVADRPNPIGLDLDSSEGPWLDEQHCSSFIGRWNIPLKHSCTLGELARYFAHSRLPRLELHVIPVPGLKRGHPSLKDGFFPTSPAMPSLQTALLYPGLGLLEGVNINEGRNTNRPFTRFGAPWLEPAAIIERLDKENIAGTTISESTFTPPVGPYALHACQAIDISVTLPDALRAVRLGISILRALYQHHGSLLQERAYPTQVNPTGANHLDRLMGQPNSFKKYISSPMEPDMSISGWKQQMNSSLIYP